MTNNIDNSIIHQNSNNIEGNEGQKDTNSHQNSQSNKSDKDRRRRINRMKTAIMIIVVLFLILPTIVCIILGIQVGRLQKQVDDLVNLQKEYGLTSEKSDGIKYTYAAEEQALTETLSIVQSGEELPGDAKSGAIVKKNSSDEGQIDNISQDALPGEEEESHAAGREENQREESEAEKGIYAGKTVYLTFDDGPSTYTDDILDILAKYRVKATFFVIGKTDKVSKQLYKRIVDEGHTLGLHSYSHKYELIYNSVEDFDKDFTKLWKLLYDTTGYKPSIYRFPGGSDNMVNRNGMEKFISYLNDASIVYFDWNVVNGDATGIEYTKDQLMDNVLDGVDKKAVSMVLMHDSQTKEVTVESLPGLLEKLIEGGAKILPLNTDVTPIQMIKADSIK